MDNKKRKYTQEFKTEAIKLVTEQSYTQAEAGKSLGVTPTNISRWIKESSPGSEKAVRKMELTAEQKELEKLRQENKRLKMEREILKKAAAFFANEPS
jgi:transposase